MIEKDSPELQQLLQELADTLDQSQHLRANLSHLGKQGQQYLEMKSALLGSYSTYLCFYLLMKVEGKEIGAHPVLHKLTNIK